MKITLCGSTRFRPQFELWMAHLALAGHVVYGLSMLGREASDEGKEGNRLVTDEEKRHLDLVHLAKIDDSDAVLILNVDGYVGDSTRRELEWAHMRGKRVFWLENVFASTQRGEKSAQMIENLYDGNPVGPAA